MDGLPVDLDHRETDEPGQGLETARELDSRAGVGPDVGAEELVAVDVAVPVPGAAVGALVTGEWVAAGNGRIGPQPQPDFEVVHPGPIGDEREVEGGAVPGDDHAGTEIGQGPVEVGELAGLVAVENDLDIDTGERDRHDPAVGRIEAVDRGVGLDVEPVPGCGEEGSPDGPRLRTPSDRGSDRRGYGAAVADECLFCRIVAGFEPAHVVMSDEMTMAFLDIRPLFVGHTLVVPRRHHETLVDLAPDDLGPYFRRVQRLARVMESELGAVGTFVAMNNRVSQSVPHLHVHVVPRRPKDGLRGFFWPRTHYDDDAHAARTAAALGRTYEMVAEADGGPENTPY